MKRRLFILTLYTTCILITGLICYSIFYVNNVSTQSYNEVSEEEKLIEKQISEELKFPNSNKSAIETFNCYCDSVCFQKQIYTDSLLKNISSEISCSGSEGNNWNSFFDFYNTKNGYLFFSYFRQVIENLESQNQPIMFLDNNYILKAEVSGDNLNVEIEMIFIKKDDEFYLINIRNLCGLIASLPTT